MEIINQELEKMTTQIEILKEENGKFTDALDEKDEEIQKLIEQNEELMKKLAQKSNEVGLQDKRLSNEHNSLKSKLLNRDKQIEELKEQIDQTKINALVAKDNEIAVLKQKIDELQQSCPRTPARAAVQPKTPIIHKTYSPESKMKHFLKFLNQYYEWIEPSSLAKDTKHANIPFEFIHNSIKRISETDTPKPKFLLNGKRAYWPDQTIMIKYLKNQQKERYGEHDWRCSKKPDMNAYNGTSLTAAQIRFDLKEK